MFTLGKQRCKDYTFLANFYSFYQIKLNFWIWVLFLMMGNFEATLDTGHFEFKYVGDIWSQISSVYNSSYFHDMTCNQIELYLYALLIHYPHFTVKSNYKMQGNCLLCWAFTLGNSYKVKTINVELIIIYNYLKI